MAKKRIVLLSETFRDLALSVLLRQPIFLLSIPLAASHKELVAVTANSACHERECLSGPVLS